MVSTRAQHHRASSVLSSSTMSPEPEHAQQSIPSTSTPTRLTRSLVRSTPGGSSLLLTPELSSSRRSRSQNRSAANEGTPLRSMSRDSEGSSRSATPGMNGMDRSMSRERGRESEYEGGVAAIEVPPMLFYVPGGSKRSDASDDEGGLRSSTLAASTDSSPDRRGHAEEDDEADADASQQTIKVPAGSSTQANGQDSASESDSSSDDDSDSDSDTETETESPTVSAPRIQLDPKTLLQRALATARSKKAAKEAATEEEVDELQMDVMQIGGSESKAKAERPIPGLSVELPSHYRRLDLQDSKTASVNGGGKGKQPAVASASASTAHEHELDDTAYERQYSRKEKMKMPRTQSANEAWASLPAPPSSLLPQMKRDYQALALSNSLDPKRFMKGGKGSSKVPEIFAIGTLHTPSRHLAATTAARERSYKPGSIVESLVNDGGINTYAKRKFDEFATKRMDNGRGKGWKKRNTASWK